MLIEQDSYIRTKVLNAVMEDPEIITILKDKYVDDELWKFCIEREPSLFKKMKHPSEEICLHACEVDGSNLRWIRNKFSYIPITDMMIYTCVKSNPKSIVYVPKKMLNDGLKEMAFDKDPTLMENFDDIRPEYLRKIIAEKPFAIQYVNNPDEDLICDAIIKDPNVCVYVNDVTDRMLHTLETYHPNYFNLYKNSYHTLG